MEAGPFIECTANWFEAWFRDIKSRIDRGEITVRGEYSFPGFLRVGESPHHYIIELMGGESIEDVAGYRIRRPETTEKIANTASFINPGYPVADGATALLNMQAEENTLRNLTFSTEYDRDEFRAKINVDLNPSHINAAFEADIPLGVTEAADRLVFRDIDLIRTEKPQIFFKRISTIIVLRKTIEQDALHQWLTNKAKEMARPPMPDILGINTGYAVSEASFAVQLLSLTQQDVQEPVVDAFIQENADFFARALGYRSAISQRRLEIVNRTGLEGDYLKPDYLMQREDGGYDILDLKKALIPSVTVGRRTRLRYSAYVTELIAQLGGYRRYFAAQENRTWVEENLGITVREDSRLIGIVGNHNNFNREQVDLAHEPYRDDIAILSYSEVIDLLRKV